MQVVDIQAFSVMFAARLFLSRLPTQEVGGSIPVSASPREVR